MMSPFIVCPDPVPRLSILFQAACASGAATTLAIETGPRMLVT